MLLATIIFLGYHDNSDVETFDFQSKVVSAHIESLNNTSPFPGENYHDADHPSAVNSVQNPLSSDPIISTYTPRPLSRLPTLSDADQRTLRQKTVDLVKVGSMARLDLRDLIPLFYIRKCRSHLGAITGDIRAAWMRGDVKNEAKSKNFGAR